MVSLEELSTRGLHAYEVGRLRMALRVTLILLPATAVCLLESKGREACGCCAALLLGAAVWLRWRDRAGVEGVTTGLLAGSVPLVAGLALARIDPNCAAAGVLSYCTLFAVLIGAASGAMAAARELRRRSRAWGWAAAATIAVLVASLGCVRLGVAAVAGVALGIVIGAAVAARAALRAG